MAIDPNNRPIRVINDDTTEQEFAAGLHIPNADPPKNEKARGGFGNRDGKEGFGTDSSEGITAVAMNATTDAPNDKQPGDNMRTAGEDADQRRNQDLPSPDDERDENGRRLRRGPANELEADDLRTGPDEMEDADSHVGMGQMAPKALKPLTGTDTNAEQNDPGAQESGLDVGF
ncbi:MAG: hypothetical protein ACRYFX_05960 [Janthinobacterium lividum]